MLCVAGSRHACIYTTVLSHPHEFPKSKNFTSQNNLKSSQQHNNTDDNGETSNKFNTMHVFNNRDNINSVVTIT